MAKSKLLIEGPLGFKTTEETAKLLERLLKTAPKGCQYKKKNLSAEVQFEPGERASIDVITTDSVDHEKEVVLPGGIDVETYRKNPVVLFAHDDTKPIGRSLWIKTCGNGIKSKTAYAKRPEDYQGDFLPDLVFALVQQQILRGRSVGFFPTEIDAPTQDQIKARPDWADANAIISKSVLFEYSVVSVPCNEDALQQAVSKGLKEFSRKSLESLGIRPKLGNNLELTKRYAKRGIETALAIQLLEQIQIDPDAIAKRVLEALRDRGRV